jgi:hypothetical protein
LKYLKLLGMRLKRTLHLFKKRQIRLCMSRGIVPNLIEEGHFICEFHQEGCCVWVGHLSCPYTINFRRPF